MIENNSVNSIPIKKYKQLGIIAFSKSFFDLEALIKKEDNKECSEAEKDAKEAKEKIE